MQVLAGTACTLLCTVGHSAMQVCAEAALQLSLIHACLPWPGCQCADARDCHAKYIAVQSRAFSHASACVAAVQMSVIHAC